MNGDATPGSVAEAEAELALIGEQVQSGAVSSVFSDFFGVEAARSPVQDDLERRRAAYLRGFVAGARSANKQEREESK